AAILVGALELSVIVGALTSGALVERTSMTVLLALPAIAVTLCFFLILFGIEHVPGTQDGRIDMRQMDLTGLGLLTAGIGLVMTGLIVIRLDGPASILAWGFIVSGVAVL